MKEGVGGGVSGGGGGRGRGLNFVCILLGWGCGGVEICHHHLNLFTE